MALTHQFIYAPNTATGKPLDGAIVRLYTNPGGVLAITYRDRALTPKPVLVTGADGEPGPGSVDFYIEQGNYDIEFNYGGDNIERIIDVPMTGDASNTFNIVTQPVAEAGSDNTGGMTPLRTKQAIEAQLKAPLAAGTGAAHIGYQRSGLNTVLRTLESCQDEMPSIMDWEGSGSDDTVRFERALAGSAGGVLTIPSRSTPYVVNGILDINVDSSVIRIAAGATIEIDIGLLGVDFSQSNFGNAFRVRADDVSIIGEGPSSILKLVNGTQGNAVGWRNAYRGYLANLTLDGGKSGVTVVEDDSFMSAFSVVAYTGGDGSNTYSDFVAENVIMRNFAQYGANIYGDRASTTLINCQMLENGKVGDPLSVGAGVVVTRGVPRFTMLGGASRGNAGHGIFGASAGLPARGFKVIGADIIGNGKRGITITEEEQWGVNPGNGGYSEIIIDSNIITDNAETGVQIGVYNSDTQPLVGPLKVAKITNNIISRNMGWGILAQSTNVANKRLENVDIYDNIITDNGDADFDANAKGLQIESGCRNIHHGRNYYSNNLAGDISDNQPFWTNFTFNGGYDSGLGAPYPVLAYAKDENGDVIFRGSIAGAAGAAAGTLPVGYRPKERTLFGDNANWGYIEPDGTVFLAAGAGGTLWIMSGVRFRAYR